MFNFYTNIVGTIRLKIFALTCATNSHCYQGCFIVNLHVLESKCTLTANIKQSLTIIFITLSCLLKFGHNLIRIIE